MITALDTNVLLDILIPGAPHAAQSKALLDEAHQAGAMVINEVVYADLASQFPSQDSLDEFLERTGIRLEPSQREALYAAAEAWQIYLSRRGPALQCAQCGQPQSMTCTSCGNPIQFRQHVLPDFLIGGHAAKQGDQLLTRDRGYYHTYFPDLVLQS
ncbi:MAG: type II toxin-antitoxin system VapC family toxin [Dehalococcoidia bacterium]